jgi:phosphoribosylglycinamide formyltransferase-1
MQKLNLALLISGGGSTAEAVIKSCRGGGKLDGLAEVACVISSNRNAGGLDKAAKAGITPECLRVVDPTQYGTPENFGRALIETLEEFHVNAVGQHGWMVITPSNVIKRFEGKMINQHPGPLDPGHPGFGGIKPGMYGARVSCARLWFLQESKLPAEHWWTEATTQLVHEKVDEGLLVHTAKVPVYLVNETVAQIQERLLPVEHEVCIEAWRQMATGEATPAPRSERLIEPAHYQLLAEAKRYAQKTYPKG